ncbi:MAG: DUF2127 domain-containing protein [Planctomycetota bacterium]
METQPEPSPSKGITKRFKKTVEAPDFGLKLIIGWKLVKATLLILIAAGAFAMLHKDLHDLAEGLVTWLHLDPASKKVESFLTKVDKFDTPAHKAELGSGAIVFALFILVEAWGLYRRRRWAELLTIAATSLLIPVEVYEICRHPSFGKVLTLLVNALIVLYLARHHYLFVPGPVGRWLHANFGKEQDGH